jgi:hypothetical protein
VSRFLWLNRAVDESIAEQAQQEMWEQVDAATAPASPTVKQVYVIARRLCERVGERWPETRAEASSLIRRLSP